MENLPSFEVIVGTYEEYLLGYKVYIDNEKVKLKQTFATHEHSSSVRTITTCGKYVASGGADDRICVYDMAARKGHIMLTHHEATVNCLEFTTGNTHIISSSTDGVLSITRVGNWMLEKRWEKAHKNGSVLSIAAHPTGKLALTLGTDCSLQTWNLIKGRKAYIINLNSKSTDAKSLNFVKWGPCGERFVLGGGLHIEIWSITTGGILKKFQYKSKVISVSWIAEDTLAAGHEDGKITILNIRNESEETYNAHNSRVKCLESQDNFLVSASSSGSIKLWTFDEDSLIEVSECNTGCRATCLSLVNALKVKKEESNKIEEENVTKLKKNGDIVNEGKKNITHYERRGIVIEEVDSGVQKKKKRRSKKKTKEIGNEVSKNGKNIKTKNNKKNKIVTNEIEEDIVQRNTDTSSNYKKNKLVMEQSEVVEEIITPTKKRKIPKNNSEKKKKIKRNSQTWNIEDV